MDKRARTDSPSKKCGGGRTVIKVTFFLNDFSEEFEISSMDFFLGGTLCSRIFFRGYRRSIVVFVVCVTDTCQLVCDQFQFNTCVYVWYLRGQLMNLQYGSTKRNGLTGTVTTLIAIVCTTSRHQIIPQGFQIFFNINHVILIHRFVVLIL